MKRNLYLFLVCLTVNFVAGQNYNLHNHPFTETLSPNVRTQIHVPNILGYKTLKCDFHLHTYFSDGHVSPDMRVMEAWREGLDAIAITDHNKLKKEFLAVDYNKSFDIASVIGQDLGMVVIKGVEFTEGKPVGHYNFLFIDDANQYDSQIIEPDAAIELAASKGAFVIWNHPGWPDENCQIYDFQRKYIDQKKIGAIEIFNHEEFYPLAIDFSMDNNLAPIGASDLHYPVDYFYDLSKTKRPMTFVFVTEDTENGIKEALLAGRTVAFFNNILTGREEYIREIFANSLEMVKSGAQPTDSLYNITNKSDITYYLDAEGVKTILPAGETISMIIGTADIDKVYTLENSYCRSQTHVLVSFPTESNDQSNIKLTDAELTYSQNFNIMKSIEGATGIDWVNGEDPLVGWFAAQTMDAVPKYVTIYSTGTIAKTASTGLVSYGSDSDRALGSRIANSTGAIAYGVKVKNATSAPISSLQITYSGEQWTYASPNPQAISFAYKLNADILDAGFTTVPELQFSSPIFVAGTTSTHLIDGNLAENKVVAITHTINVNIPVGEFILLRWLDINDAGVDHGLAIDDVTITATVQSGINETQAENIKLFVNSDNVVVKSEKILREVVIYNALGRQMLTQSVKSGEVSIPISHLSGGAYFAKATMVDGSVSTIRFIK